MPRRRLAWLVALAACEAASPAPAADFTPTPDNRRDLCLDAHADVPDRYRGVLNAFCSEQAHLGVVGASLAVAEDGVLKFTATAGQRCAGGPPVTPDTAFRIGSLTKLPTAALALHHLPDLDAPLPELAEFTDPRAATITARHLLHHTAGLSDLDPRDTQTTPWRTTLAARPLWTDPGAVWSYSNAGYALLGAALERTAGAAYSDLLDRLLAPLHLAHTTADLDRAVRDGAACGHLGRHPDAIPLDVRLDLAIGAAGATWTIPAGGVIASAPDLVALVLGLHGDASPLAPAARRRLFTADTPTHERPGELQAPGTRTQPLTEGEPLHRLGGHTGDFTADLSFAPDRGFVLVLLTNTGDPLRATLAAAHHDLLGLDPAPQDPPSPAQHYAGTYTVPGWHAPITVADDLTLTAPALDLAAVPLVPAGDHRFRTRQGPPLALTFVFTADPAHATHLRARSFVATHQP